MLTNNVAALERSKSVSRDEALAILERVRDYGERALPVTRLLEERSEASVIVASADNADLDGMTQVLARMNPAGLIAGMRVLLVASGAERAVLVLRSPADAPAITAAASDAGIELTVEISDMVDARGHKNGLMLNIETLAAIADFLSGAKPGVILSLGECSPRELPFGTPLSELTSACGIKAISIGHRFLAPDALDEPVSGEKSYGSGVLRFFGEDDCLVERARRELSALRMRSCGKCVICREGLYQLAAIFIDATENRSRKDDRSMIEELAAAMTDSARCQLGRAAGASAASLVSAFGSEFEEHVKRHHCTAGECLAYTTFYVDPDVCQGCGECVRACPASCIEGRPGYVSVVDAFACTRCGACVASCPSGAVKKTTESAPKLPDRQVRVRGGSARPDDGSEEPTRGRTPARRGRTTLVMPGKKP